MKNQSDCEGSLLVMISSWFGKPLAKIATTAHLFTNIKRGCIIPLFESQPSQPAFGGLTVWPELQAFSLDCSGLRYSILSKLYGKIWKKKILS